MAIDLDRLERSALAARAPGQGIAPRGHFVELYEEVEPLVESVRTFLSVSLIQGDAAVVIANASHRKKLEGALSQSVDMQAASERGLFASLDAEQTLAAFMEDGLPDPTRFEQVLRNILERASGNSHKVRMFGEMVTLLWERGNVAGALALEDLWNRLSEKHDFRLFCAYPTSLFDAEDQSAVTELCARHSAILISQAEAK